VESRKKEKGRIVTLNDGLSLKQRKVYNEPEISGLATDSNDRNRELKGSTGF
jgi:hypothetical protein